MSGRKAHITRVHPCYNRRYVMIRIRLRHALLVVAASLALAACSSGVEGYSEANKATQSGERPVNTGTVATPAPSDQATNPCTLLSTDEIAQVLGDKYALSGPANPGAVGPFFQRICTRTAASGAHTVVVQTQVDDKPHGEAWQLGVSAAKNNGLYEPFEVYALGDEAYYSTPSSVTVRKGTTIVQVLLPETELNDTTRSQLKDLAAAAVGSLGG
jgi:hypothetical protein